ncbi:zinc finger CCCH domain-containing protein 10-like [Cardiocondyla obscurior]|uniref:zinc finger CCCH domain-containing protein 10-like n=1 Tax=Cardiocondyla obscurior TaxID=286306 RepID=UPI0039656368
MAYFGEPAQKQQLCRDFQRGACSNSYCAFVHPYRYCFNYQNKKCTNAQCRFLHVTSVEQARYEATGLSSAKLRYEVGRTLQNSIICGDYKAGRCNRTDCQRRHIGHDEKLECIVCCGEIVLDTFGASSCGHVYCYTCALKCQGPPRPYTMLTVVCPVCRSVPSYEQLH